MGEFVSWLIYLVSGVPIPDQETRDDPEGYLRWVGRGLLLLLPIGLGLLLFLSCAVLMQDPYPVPPASST